MAKGPVRTKKGNYFTSPNKKQKNNFNNSNKKPQGIIKRKFIKNRPQIQDVRQKIIQKKRKQVVDARDILAKMAKTQDARNKLNKIRENKGVGGGNLRTMKKENIKIIGNHIVKKTDRNGQISLVTNKSKTSTGMNMAIQKELGLVNPGIRKPITKIPPRKHTTNAINAVLDENSSIKYFRRNEYEQTPSVSSFKWINPAPPASQLILSLEARKRAAALAASQEYMYENPYPLRSVRTSYVDLDAVEDEEMPLVQPQLPPIKQTISLQGSSRISNVHSRLDSTPVQSESHGIFSQTKTKVVVPAGHRIVVSNLQPTVTQDDVKELFEDIGQLLAARLVRPGVAEVIYKNLKDAQKAVDTYHNRQLDGQPMKCLLVNKRPINNPTAPALSESQRLMMKPKEIATTSSSNKLIPDISTIHKVLFQRK